MRRARAVYGILLHGFPAPFRHEYGDQMALMFVEQLRQARRTGGWRRETVVWLRAAWDLVTIAPKEHAHVLRQDLQHAFRTMAGSPVFTSVAILSLAIGIGANTAIFSLWHSVRYASLPAVEKPQELVMLTAPSATGLWFGRTDGPRQWATFDEFEQLRDQLSDLATVMAAQSSLNNWQARIDGASVEETSGRLVSSGFFDVLGVRPALGRLFTAADGERDIPEAVVSHAYWHRRFGGRADVLGRTLTVGNTPLTIVGVAPEGFVGESSGQQPDVWLPLRLQPRVLPGTDWIHNTPPEKVMWLHLFARLKPTISAAQVETRANTVFRAGLKAFYGPGRSDDVLDQELRVHPGARGASATVEQFSTSATMLLAGVGILLLVACANLANLLLARGAARRNEIAVRLSLGASRGRLIRQLVTETLALAVLGGIGAIAIASVLHGVLVRMLQEADSDLFVRFAFNLPVAAFGIAATFAAALAFGLLPAWQLTRSDVGEQLRESRRGAVGSLRELRSGRWLVAGQLALSLPLLIAAGLLVRTVYNFQHPDLGYPVERLVLARVSLGELVQDVPRRDRVLRDLLARVQRLPGVDAASFSQLGVFGGALSSATIEVEGSALTRERPQDVALDRVAAGYFTTLRIPIRLGRDIADTDRAEGPFVCVVNEAFVRRFLPGRSPIGARLARVDNLRRPYEIVGVVADAHIHGLRGDVEPRFFVPAEQRRSLGGSRTFLIRTASDPIAIMAAVRQALDGVDPAISIADIRSMEDHIGRLTAEERGVARLAVAFGAAALLLATIGLYGVLSYGVARRSSEIAIRLALGAHARTVVAMILKESTGLVLLGLAAGAALTAGAALAYGGAQVDARLLYRVEPHDPRTIAVAVLILLAVALAAAYVPARRASRMDPMAALHQG
jgi:predicted permease